MTNYREVTVMWTQHYDELLNGTEVEHQDSRGNGFICTADESNVFSTPIISEVKDAIMQSSSSRAKKQQRRIVECNHRILVAPTVSSVLVVA